MQQLSNSVLLAIAMLAAAALSFCLNPVLAKASSEPGSEITVTQDGKVSIKRAKVMQIAGSNFYTRVTWENIFVRVTVVTNGSTEIRKNHGERAVPADFHEGDVIDIEGSFPSGSESFMVNATSIKNRSLEKQEAQYAGTVTSVRPDSDEFGMSTKEGVITQEGSRFQR